MMIIDPRISQIGKILVKFSPTHTWGYTDLFVFETDPKLCITFWK